MSETREKSKCGKCPREWVPDFSCDCYTIDGVDLCEPCAMPYLMNARDPEPVNKVRVEDFCMLGKGEATCAFLVMASDGYVCAKYSTLEHILRERLTEGSIRAKGDNCSGPPVFKVRVVQ
jgi:hypothetical protein